MQLLTIVAILFAVGGVVFALQNMAAVSVTFLIWRFDSSLALVLLLALALGALILGLVSTPATLRRQWAIARMEKRIAELEDQVDTQQETITELRKKIPPAKPVEESDKTLPYMGLKQLMTGGDKKPETPPGQSS